MDESLSVSGLRVVESSIVLLRRGFDRRMSHGGADL